MTSVKPKLTGSAAMHGDLWGSRARDWADVQEATVRPLYDAVLQRAELRNSTALLDAGCGAGMFARLAAAKGARVTGLDAAPALLAIARARVPSGAFDDGDLEDLPYEDASFDVITGFGSFQYAANRIAALREARRVAKPGALVFIATWGRAQDCEAAAYLAAIGENTPALGAAGPFALSEPRALETLASQAGLTPVQVVDVDCAWRYPDLVTALRGLLSAGPAVGAIRRSGEDAVCRAVTKAIASFKTARGGYVLENKFRFVVARA